MAMETAAACAGSCRRGACINGTCVCANGWSGSADLLTGDLTAWGGPVLDCTSHLLTLQVSWSIVLALCTVALIVIPFTAHQQWQKYQVLRTQGVRKHWYRYRPLLFVAGHAITLLVMCSMAAVKVTTHRFERVVGIDLHLTIGMSIVNFFGIPVSAVFLLEVFATFSRGIHSEMAQSLRWQRALRISWLLLVLAILLVASCGVYAIAHLFVSPLAGRSTTVLFNKLWMVQCATATLFGSVALVVFAIDTLRSINHTVREREVLARWTRSRELRESVASLRRTRLKVGVLLITTPIATTICGFAELWIGSNSERQQYGSYLIVFTCGSYLQIVLLVLDTYTTINIPSRQQLLQALGLRRPMDGNAVSPPGRISCSELSVPHQANSASAAAQTVQHVSVSIASGGASTSICTDGSNVGARELTSNLRRMQPEEPLSPLTPHLPQHPQHTQYAHHLHV